MKKVTRALLKAVAEASDSNEVTPAECWYHISPAVVAWEQAGQPDKDEPRKTSSGMEVTPGWVMPDPPRPGMTACFELHGGDGWALFWWDNAWGEFANSNIAYGKAREEGIDHYIDDTPLVHPDTGGANYKATEEALRELGFDG